MLTRKISFHVIDVPDGQILIRLTKNVYECWTCSDEEDGIIVFEFGLPVFDKVREKADRKMTLERFIDIVMDNYEDGYLFDNDFFSKE